MEEGKKDDLNYRTRQRGARGSLGMQGPQALAARGSKGGARPGVGPTGWGWGGAWEERGPQKWWGRQRRDLGPQVGSRGKMEQDWDKPGSPSPPLPIPPPCLIFQDDRVVQKKKQQEEHARGATAYPSVTGAGLIAHMLEP